MASCDYANARIRGMKSRLLGPKGINELLAQPSLQARLEYLKKTDYGEGLASHLLREPDPLRGAERGLRVRLADDLRQIDSFFRGEPVRPLFRAVLAFEDGWNIKTVLRGITRGEPPDRTFLLLAPTPELGDPELEEMVRQKDVRGVVDLLATWGSRYAGPLADAFARYRTHRDLFVLEVALDQFLFAQALEAARVGGEDGRILSGFLRSQIDLTNAGTLLKRADGGPCDDLFVPGGRAISFKIFHRLAGLKARDLLEALAQTRHLAIDPRLATMGERPDPFAIDRMLQQALREAMHREARIHPLSLAVALSFVLERRAEAQRIRLVLRGAEFGVPGEDLLALVEA
jgi:V/A-type H+/Na+-transporting ATPase subunit C